jgi:CheY-like chemotaxis protein/anti-sigma regulatory factor (Ser/Thr protein kinase)
MTLLNDLLDLSRIEAGQMEISPIEAGLREELRRIEMLFRSMAEERGLQLRFDFAEDIPERLIFDPVRVRQCVGNLVSNAIKFTDAGSVRVSAYLARPGLLRIDVADTGVGLDEAALQRIFQAFVQARAEETEHTSGTGLGLTICRQLARQMGGDVTARSAPGEGSVFSITLRVKDVETGIAGDQNVSIECWLRGLEVLVVDDIGTNAFVMRGLMENAGASVRVAENGQQALDLLEEKQSDLVLLDLQMPVMDGWQATRAIREGPNSDSMIIAVSAHMQDDDRDKCLDAGMDGLLLKPITPDALFSEIGAVRVRRLREAALRANVA